MRICDKCIEQAHGIVLEKKLNQVLAKLQVTMLQNQKKLEPS
jgi:hypothetical protein